MTNKETRSIVYVKNGIGNIILMTPAIQAIASLDSSKQVDICLDSNWADYRKEVAVEFFNNWNIVQNIIQYPKEKFIKDYKIWFYTDFGEYSEALKVFKSKNNFPVFTTNWASFIHETFYYLIAAEKFGFSGKTPPLFVPVKLTEKLPDDKLKICICNGGFSTEMNPAKQWPFFAELVHLLKNYYDCYIVKVGKNKELKNVEADFDFVNKLSFCETIGIISQCDFIICNDTGLMHAADALDKKGIVIWGGTRVSKNGTLNKSLQNVKLNLSCQPCQHKSLFNTCTNRECLYTLTAIDVITIIRSLL